MRRILVFIISALLASCFDANGQNFLERLGQRAKNAAENKLGEKVEQAVNDVLDGKIGTNEKKETADKQTADPVSQDAVAMPDAKVPAQPKKQVETSYAKTDFVPGDEIFFDDPVEGEKVVHALLYFIADVFFHGIFCPVLEPFKETLRICGKARR